MVDLLTAPAAVEPRCWRDGEMDANAYAAALQSLAAASTQVEPDGRDCAVCGGNDHQAFECEFNPLAMARLAVARTVHQDGLGHGRGGLPELSDASEYRCFHCGHTPTSRADAEQHFGSSNHEIPACLARTDAQTITAIVDAVREEDDDEQAEVMVRHLLRGRGCEDGDGEVEHG
jgi:hypothetical protein